MISSRTPQSFLDLYKKVSVESIIYHDKEIKLIESLRSLHGKRDENFGLIKETILFSYLSGYPRSDMVRDSSHFHLILTPLRKAPSNSSKWRMIEIANVIGNKFDKLWQFTSLNFLYATVYSYEHIALAVKAYFNKVIKTDTLFKTIKQRQLDLVWRSYFHEAVVELVDVGQIIIEMLGKDTLARYRFITSQLQEN